MTQKNKFFSNIKLEIISNSYYYSQAFIFMAPNLLKVKIDCKNFQ